MDRILEMRSEFEELQKIELDLWAIAKGLDEETKKKLEKIQDRLYVISRPGLQMMDELMEDYREKEFVKVSFPKKALDLVQEHMKLYERLLGKKEREEFDNAIYNGYCK